MQLRARLEGLEPPANGFEGRCSIQLSYRRVVLLLPSLRGPVKLRWRRRPPGLPQKNKGIRRSRRRPRVTIPLQSILDARQGAI